MVVEWKGRVGTGKKGMASTSEKGKGLVARDAIANRRAETQSQKKGRKAETQSQKKGRKAETQSQKKGRKTETQRKERKNFRSCTSQEGRAEAQRQTGTKHVKIKVHEEVTLTPNP